MASEDRIQLCGQFAVRIDGRQRAHELRGLQARALLAFLVFERHRTVDRFDAVEALWGEQPPAASAEALRALFSNVRRAVGGERLVGRDELRLSLPDGIWIDVEVAARAAHDAESAVALRQWQRAWVAAHIAMNIAERPLLPRWNGSWIEDRRVDLERTRLRALEALAGCGVALAGTELSTARRAAQALIDADPCVFVTTSGLLRRRRHFACMATCSEARRPPHERCANASPTLAGILRREMINNAWSDNERGDQ